MPKLPPHPNLDHLRHQAKALADDPDLLNRFGALEHSALVRAAKTGDDNAVALMLDLGFPVESRGDDGGTELHAAAYCGSVSTVRMLLERGAEIEARETLLEHGASAGEINFSPDDPSPPSPEVAALLREHNETRRA
jgi:ankyrin repeat protein